MHKRICGTRAVPFQYPGFTRTEINDMVALSNKPFKLPGGTELLTFSDSLWDGCEGSRDEESCDVIFAASSIRPCSCPIRRS